MKSRFHSEGLLSELLDPTPQRDFDPEDVDTGRTDSQYDHSFELDEDDVDAANVPMQRSVLRSRIAMNDPSFLTGRYAGRPVSRNSLDSIPIEEEEIDEDEDSSLLDDIFVGEEEEEEEEEEEGNYIASSSTRSNRQSSDRLQNMSSRTLEDSMSVASNVSSLDEEAEGSDHDDESQSSSFSLDSDDDLLQELENIEREDSSSSALRILSEEVEKERDRGVATRNQKQIGNLALKARILLQKPLVGMEKLPRPHSSDDHVSFDAFLSPEKTGDVSICKRISDKRNELRETLFSLVNLLLSIQQLSFRQRPEQSEDDDPEVDDYFQDSSVFAMDEHDVEHTWNSNQVFQERLREYRNKVLESTQQRVRITSGSAASVQGNSFRAIQVGILQQVDAVLSDSQRIRRKAHLLRSGIRILGKRHGDSSDGMDLKRQRSEGNDGILVDEEIYSDSDFYQQLLREFLNVDAPATEEGNRVLVTRKKEYEHRHGSKGRKLRYNIHEKLVHFCTPRSYEYPPVVDALYPRLFGLKADSGARPQSRSTSSQDSLSTIDTGKLQIFSSS